MRTKVLTTALGEIVVVHPLAYSKNMTMEYGCSHFNKNGQWQSTGIHPDKKAASKARTRTFRMHRRIAKKEKGGDTK